MIRRSRRGIPATLVALVLLVVCGLVATVSIQLIAGRPPLISYQQIVTDLHRMPWNNLWVGVVAGVVALIGLVLLLAALIPGGAMVLPLSAEDAGHVAGVSRRSLRSTLRTAAESVDGIAKTKLRLRGNSVTLVAHADRTDDTGLADALHGALTTRIETLTPAAAPTLRIRVHPARKKQP